MSTSGRGGHCWQTTTGEGDAPIRHRKWRRRRLSCQSASAAQLNQLVHRDGLADKLPSVSRRSVRGPAIVALNSWCRELSNGRFIFHETSEELRLTQLRLHGRNGRPRSGCYFYYYYCICCRQCFGRHSADRLETESRPLEGSLDRKQASTEPPTRSGWLEASKIESNYHNSHFALQTTDHEAQFNQLEPAGFVELLIIKKVNSSILWRQDNSIRRKECLQSDVFHTSSVSYSPVSEQHCVKNSHQKRLVSQLDSIWLPRLAGYNIKRQQSSFRFDCDKATSTRERPFPHTDRRPTAEEEPMRGLAPQLRLLKLAQGRAVVSERLLLQRSHRIKGKKARSGIVAASCQDQAHRTLIEIFRGIITDPPHSVMLGYHPHAEESTPGTGTRLHNSLSPCALILACCALAIALEHQTGLESANKVTLYLGGRRKAAGGTSSERDMAAKWWLKLIAPVVLAGRFAQQRRRKRFLGIGSASGELSSSKVLCGGPALRESDQLLTNLCGCSASQRSGRSVVGANAAGSLASSDRGGVTQARLTRDLALHCRSLFIHPTWLAQAHNLEPGEQMRVAANEEAAHRSTSGCGPNWVRKDNAVLTCGWKQARRFAAVKGFACGRQLELPASSAAVVNGSAPRWRMQWLDSLRRFREVSEPKRARAMVTRSGEELTRTHMDRDVQIIVDLNELTVVKRVRQLYDYICIDWRHCGPAWPAGSCCRLRLSNAPLCARASSAPPWGPTRRAQSRPSSNLAGRTLSPTRTHCNGIMEANSISETESGPQIDNCEPAKRVDELAKANLCANAGMEKSLNNNNNDDQSLYDNTTGHSRLAAHYHQQRHCSRRRRRMQCQCRHYYYYHYYYYRCRLVERQRRALLGRGGVSLELPGSCWLLERSHFGRTGERADKLITGGSDGGPGYVVAASSVETSEGAWSDGPKPLARAKVQRQQQSRTIPLEPNDAGSNEDARDHQMARPRPAAGAAVVACLGRKSGGERENMSWRRMSARKSPRSRLGQPGSLISLLLPLALLLLTLFAPLHPKGPLVRLAAAAATEPDTPNASRQFWLPLDPDEQRAVLGSAKQNGSRYEQTQREKVDDGAVMSENNAKTSRTKQRFSQEAGNRHPDLIGSHQDCECEERRNKFQLPYHQAPSSGNQDKTSKASACKRRKLNNDADDNGDAGKGEYSRDNSNNNLRTGYILAEPERASWNDRRRPDDARQVVGGPTARGERGRVDSAGAHRSALLDVEPASDETSKFLSDEPGQPDELATNAVDRRLGKRQRAFAEGEIKRTGRVGTRNDEPTEEPPIDLGRYRLVSSSSEFDGLFEPSASANHSEASSSIFGDPSGDADSSHEQPPRRRLDTTSGQARLLVASAEERNNGRLGQKSTRLIGISSAARPLADGLFQRSHFRPANEHVNRAAAHHHIARRHLSASQLRNYDHRNHPHLQHGGRHLGAMLPIMGATISNDINAGARSCPVQCQCVWKNGKQFADCSSNRHALTQLPSGLDPLLQVLNISANYLTHLPESAFVSRNLQNLQRIYMSR